MQVDPLGRLKVDTTATLGQDTMTNSAPVVLASDHSLVPIANTGQHVVVFNGGASSLAYGSATAPVDVSTYGELTVLYSDANIASTDSLQIYGNCDNGTPQWFLLGSVLPTVHSALRHLNFSFDCTGITQLKFGNSEGATADELRDFTTINLTIFGHKAL